MTKTELLNFLEKKHGSIVRYKDIENAVHTLRGQSSNSRGLGMYALALYPTRYLIDGVVVDYSKAYFARPSKGEPRFLRPYDYGRYQIATVSTPVPRNTPMSKTKLIDRLLEEYGSRTFTFTDIRKMVNDIRGYDLDAPMGSWSMALYGGPDSPNFWHGASRTDGYFTRPTATDSRYLKKLDRGVYMVAH